MSGSVIAGLYLVVDINRDRARHSGNIAADHEHDSELAQCVCEAESEAGHESCF